MYYRAESQPVITRQGFSLQGEMREIAAGVLWFPLSGIMSGDRGRQIPLDLEEGMKFGILEAWCP